MELQEETTSVGSVWSIGSKKVTTERHSDILNGLDNHPYEEKDTTLLIFHRGWFCQIKSGCPMANISLLVWVQYPNSTWMGLAIVNCRGEYRCPVYKLGGTGPSRFMYCETETIIVKYLLQNDHPLFAVTTLVKDLSGSDSGNEGRETPTSRFHMIQTVEVGDFHTISTVENKKVDAPFAIAA
ncbi:hypothetical protein VNO80_06440 [Phaseolus coccineus]|uniref:Uncharacterized protein n=1 Tax=Phaseolus coccineus TaxID=3886 RepID=A0AAN9NID3_PHACN